MFPFAKEYCSTVFKNYNVQYATIQQTSCSRTKQHYDVAGRKNLHLIVFAQVLLENASSKIYYVMPSYKSC